MLEVLLCLAALMSKIIQKVKAAVCKSSDEAFLVAVIFEQIRLEVVQVRCLSGRVPAGDAKSRGEEGSSSSVILVSRII